VGNVIDALTHHDAIAVTGSNPGVGIIGWITGGGHGPLSSSYGMGSDNLLEVRIAVPSGQVLTANECHNADLFWALRGGGGGTFGVVTSITVKTFPSPKTSTWSLWASLADESKEHVFWDVVAWFHTDMHRMKDSGFQGYYYILGPPTAAALTLGLYFWAYDQADEQVSALTRPLRDKLDALEDAMQHTHNLSHHPTFHQAYKGDSETEPVGIGGMAMTSRLMPASAFEDADRLVRLFKDIGPSSPGVTVSTVLFMGMRFGRWLNTRGNRPTPGHTLRRCS
jgi:FAD/FMN-containing dehydrogenase